MSKTKEHSEKYSISYGCDCHEIDSRTLSVSLSRITEIVDIANNHLNTGKKIEIKVKAFKEGSFEVNFEFVQFGFEPDAFSNANSQIGQVVKLLTELAELLKVLGGKRAKKILQDGDIVLVTSFNDIELKVSKLVYDFFTRNSSANSLLQSHFRELEKDSIITSFSILDSNKRPILSIVRDDFKKIAATNEPQTEEREISDIAYLTVFKVVFGKKYKWLFYYKGSKISAAIQDDSFYKVIDGGEPFSQGDALQVDLRIRQKFDSKINAFLNDSFYIMKVLRHIPRAEQLKLRLE